MLSTSKYIPKLRMYISTDYNTDFLQNNFNSTFYMYFYVYFRLNIFYNKIDLFIC